MIDKELKKLINLEIDGGLSKKEQAELVRKLENNPEASAYQADLKRLAGALSHMPQETPPPHFKKTVMNRVRTRSGLQPAPKSIWAGISDKLAGNLDRRLIAAFALGCAVGFGFLVTLTGEALQISDEDSQLVGSLRSFQPSNPSTDSRTIDVDLGDNAAMQITTGPDHAFMTVILETASELEVQIQFSEQDVEITGLQREPGADGKLALASGNLTILASRGVYGMKLWSVTGESTLLKITARGPEVSTEEKIRLEFVR